MLDGPDPLHMPGARTQEELLHNLSQHQSQADSPVVLGILLLALLLEGSHIGKPPVIWDLPC